MGNSSSTPSSSTTTKTNTNGEKYDVFISFRGEDTRNGFTSHLYQALHEKQIKTFIDNQLKRGEEISEGLWSAIGESKIFVIIFSENYASSKWCLRELAEIMKYREMKKQIVIPVFYKVDPSHVRKQIESYEAAFAKHENELQQEDVVKKWRDALTKASKISGFHSSNARNEAEFVCNIVSDVWNKLNNICPCDFKELVKGLVGIEKPIERVVSLLCLGVSDFRIIGIWGMGGMGKTTIADAVFHLVSHQFEKTHFALCVRAESEKDSSGLFRLRDKIISKVLSEENLEIGSLSIPQWIKRRLNQKKVLIVLDDVDKLVKFEILAGGLDRFGPGSRIILTTRDKQVLHNCGVEDHNMYKVEGLNDDEALQLFYDKAFKQNNPTEDLKVLSRKVVKIARNVPLAVRVLGGSLLNKKSKQDWENAVDKFRRNVNSDVFVVLRISYDGLDKEEKGLFLDIACFVEFNFKIKKEDLELNLSSDRGFSLIGLIDKSLVTVEHGSIKMHDLLREMGREIVDKESPNKPGIRSRLWRQEDVLHALKHNDGTEAVQGISLSIFRNLEDVQLGSQVFSKMYNLRTLIINYGGHFHNVLDFLPDKLRYLHWNWYTLEVLPSSLNPEDLVELDLSYSQIKQLWEGSTRVPNLKWLKLDYCKNLISIPDLLNIPSAEIINLNNCSSLIEIHSSRECPKNLHSLQLEGCKSLSRLPSNIHLSEEPSFSTSVVLHSSREGSEFSLSGCISLTKFPHISGNIKSLDLSGSGVEEVPSTIERLSKLERLNMAECGSLNHISESICKLKSLDQLDLTGCWKLESFPDILEGMELKYLNLRGTAIKELPPSIGNLNRLEELVLSNVYGCSKLEKLPSLSGLCSLTVLKLNNSNLTEISEDIGCLSSLERLDLRQNFLFGKLPKSIKKLSKLYHLRISYCDMLRSLPELPSSLRYLEAMDCEELIQSLPDESEIELCADGYGSFIFNFMNCLKLNQKAVRNLFRDSVLKMQLMGTEKIISLFKVISPPPLPTLNPFFSFNIPPDEEVKVSICLPGSGIPEWFSYKNNGSSINIPGLRNDCGRSSYIMGFEVCLVIGIEGYNDGKHAFLPSNDVCYDFHIETSDGHKEGFVRNSIQLSGMQFLRSDHILLGYNLSRKCYEFFQVLDTLLANRGMSDYVGTSFEFNFRSKDFSGRSINLGPHCKVKYCGIQPIYISGCNDTAEETCEPHPKGICTEAKDFEGFIDDNSNFNSNNNNNNCKETAIEELDLELHIGHSSFYNAHMNSVSINQNTGDTSGCNDTVEETCEPHPKRICTEANQFS